MKTNKLLIQILSILLALTLTAPIQAAEAEESTAPERYILLLEEGCDAEKLAKKLTDSGSEVIYIYDRLLDGICIYTSEDRGTLADTEGVSAVLIPQIYTMLANESTPAGMLSDKESAEDARHAAAAIESVEGADGRGTVVAILDAGFDTKLNCLTLTDTTGVKLTKQDVLGCRSSLCADQQGFSYWQDAWGRYKVPFSYDYAEYDQDVSTADNTHGNHTAAIVAGNGEMKGAAPEAQLLLMKVAVNLYGSSLADEGDILAALEDSVTLGADVICLPLGAPLITGEDGTPGYALSLALDSAVGEGVSVIAAAGNDGERSEAPADSPDTSTLHGFASLPSVTAVGSADYFMRTLPALETEGGFRFIFTDTCEDVSGISFTDALDGKKLEIAVIPGIGLPEDFKDIGLDGKLALIKRGEIPFADKVNNAEEAGAVGVIVYNNEEAAALVNMQLDNGSIPAVFVSMEAGEKLAAAADSQRLIIASEAYMQVEVDGGGLVSEFSSRGIGKPDLVAFGSALTPPDAKTVYDTVEGTSYSAALTAGYTAVLISQRRAVGGDTTPEGIRTALMNSAAVIEISDVPLSTRSQGAGRLSLAAALENSLILTAKDGGASLSLGNIGSKTAFTLTLKNGGKTARTLTVTASPTAADTYSYSYDEESGMLLPSDESDGHYPYYVGSTQEPLADASVMLMGSEINRFAENHAPITLTLAPGESTSLAITLDLSKVDLSKACENGCFAEGFIEIREENSTVVSLPFCGFAGEREALSPVGLISFASYAANSYIFDTWQLGANAFEEIAIEENAFSPNRDGSYEYATLRMELLRDIDRFYYEVLTDGGEVIYTSPDYIDLYSAASGGAVTVDVWDGSDPENARYIYPDGDYSLRLHLYDGAFAHTVERTLTLDTEKPEIEVECLSDDTLTCTFRDSVGIQYTCVYAIDEDGLFHSFYTEHIPSADECAGFTHTFDLTGLEEGAGWLYVEVCDYAFNIYTLRIPLEGTEA
ncbi:MAG: S8 family serine peptidase [Clostridia bacterium]|nr:S8 family serine peptidase [Clostridia bacterium]